MRNPWGKDQSYKGGWEANSSAWKNVSESVQNEVNSRNQFDGQFLIAYADFASQFDEIDFVHVDFNAFYDQTNPTSAPSKWTSQIIFGAWVVGKNAGGCGNDDYRNYWLNPQYCFTLPTTNDGGKVSLIAALLQCDQVKNRLRNKGNFVESNIPQAFTIYKVIHSYFFNSFIQEQILRLKYPKKDRIYSFMFFINKIKIKPEAFNSHEKKYSESDLTEMGTTGVYVAKKEVSKRFELDPGNYIIIPSLFDKGAESNFVIRLFFESDIVDAESVQIRKMKSDPHEQERIELEQEQEAAAGDNEVQDQENDESQYQEQEQYGENEYDGQNDYQGGHRGHGGHGGYGRGGRRGRGGRNGRRRFVEAPVQINNYEEMGRFSSFLSHPKSISQVREEMENFMGNGAGNEDGNNEYGRSMKNSRACSIM